MDIPQGYKQTELGIIPEDWEIVNLGSVAKINGRIGFRGYTTADLVGVGQGAYTIGGKHITNMVLDLHDAEYISWQKYYESPEIMVRKGDIVFAQRGTLGKSAFIVNDIGPATINPSLVLINKIKCDNEYLSYWLQCDKIVEYICSINSQTSIPMITQNQIEHIPVVLSRIKAEQQAIAEALGDIDGLIATLDKKIAKKRLIKQGAMSQLLTGKKRLPGFSDPWVEKKLGEIGYTYSGLTGKSKDDFGQGNAKYITFLNVLANPILKENLFGSITIRENEQQNKVQFGDLFFNTSSETPEDVGTCAVLLSYHEELYLNSFCFGYRLTDDNVLGLYLAYYFRSRLGRQLMTSLAQGATRYNLSKELFNASRIILPETKDEQIAIATMLNDMDKEIDDLEAQRDKYRLLKSGMMQKLLTGQIRLTKPLTNVVPLVPGDSAVREIPVDAHIWAGHIVNRLWQSKGWGRTKLQKSLHLVGCYAQLDLGEEYIRNTAGPDDQRLMNYIDRKFKQYRHVNIEKERLLDGKIHYTYTPTSRIQEVEMAYERYPQDIRERVDNLLDKLNLMNLAEAEILSTLYAVWNNRIIKGERITDDLLVSDFYAWSEHKADFGGRKVRRMLDYMCKENIVPIGWGKYIDEK